VVHRSPLPSSAGEAFGHDFSRVKAHTQPGNELPAYPEQETRRLAVLTHAVSREDVEQAFQSTAAPLLRRRSSLAFGSSVAAEKAAREGLSRVAAYLESVEILRPSSSISLEIEAAGGIYRFTAVGRTTQLGPREVGFAPPETVLIEKIGPLTGPGPSGDPQKSLPTERVSIQKVKLKRGPGWTESEWLSVTAVLAELPDSALDKIAGIELLRRPAGTDTEPAESNVIAGTMTFFDSAFQPTATRFGSRSWFHHVVAHEIGHFADAEPLRKVIKHYYNKKKWSSAVSHAGFVWGPANGSTPVPIEGPPGVKETLFRQAAAQDGVTDRVMLAGVTSYAAKSWREQFAEAYALYLNDPALLRTIRPNIYRYLETAFPPSAPQR
jgi:hypothetical protein